MDLINHFSNHLEVPLRWRCARIYAVKMYSSVKATSGEIKNFFTFQILLRWLLIYLSAKNRFKKAMLLK